MTRTERDLYHVAPQIRKTLVSRVFFYWCGLVIFVTLPLVIGTTLAKPEISFLVHLCDVVSQHWLLYVMTLGVLPFVIRDVLRTTNRTLGPLDRLRQELARYRATGAYERVRCRQDDFLHDLFEEINDAITRHARNREDEGKVLDVEPGPETESFELAGIDD